MNFFSEDWLVTDWFVEELDVIVVFACLKVVWMVFFLLTWRISMASGLTADCWTCSVVSTCSEEPCCWFSNCIWRLSIWREERRREDCWLQNKGYKSTFIFGHYFFPFSLFYIQHIPFIFVARCLRSCLTINSWYFEMASSVSSPSASPSSAALLAISTLWEPGGVQPTPFIQFRSDL